MEYLYAFIVGGLICVIGQILIDKTRLTPARILVSFVIAGVILTALGLYEPLVEFAGAGATVPLTGFGYLLAEGTLNAVRQYGAMGILSGGITAVACGVASVIVFSLIAALISKPKRKT
ncbi:MAG: stage V sporulation protein AE [Clostridia bacterium]|nr:stage V sporulation protein AE [Clostridia bacterium]